MDGQGMDKQGRGVMKTSRIFKSFSRITIAILALCPFMAVKGDWESDANVRIEQNRKRNAQIAVVDSQGQPVPGISAQIEQVTHRFAFGACIARSPLSSNAAYRNFILNHFEWAVCENETKWGSNEGTRDIETYSDADYIYNWCNDNGIKMRGHCLFWEQVNGNFPAWLENLSYAAYPASSDMLGEVDERLNSAVNHFKGKFVNWDVDNEMLSDSFFTSRLGNAGIVHMFNASKAIDPNCGMFMNEYSGNSFGGYNSGPYVTRANTLIGLGATIDGYGIQAHLAENAAFQPQSYYDNVLQPLAVFGKPIWATEFDASHTNATTSADNIENFFRICFSHSSVDGIIMWGFMNGQMWRTNAGLCDSSGNLTVQGQRYEALMDEWTTNDSNMTGSTGIVNFRGFHGTYEITLSAPGQTTEVYTIEIEPGTTTEQFELETILVPPGPDDTPPTPDPLTWATAPHATGPTTISMTATTATDPYGVEYYFDCLTPGGHDSAWQDNPAYQDTGLNPNTQYIYRVQARDKSSNQNETGWSTEQSTITEPPGAEVEILGAWVAGTSHTKEDSLNRALILIAHGEYGGADMNLVFVTYGGQPMTKIIERNAGTGYRSYVAAYILNEQGVAAAISDTFVPTWSITPESASYASVFLSNVNQTTPVGPNDSNGTAGSTPNPIKTNPLATDDGDIVIEGATCGNLGSYTLNNGFIEGIDQAVGSAGHTGITGHKKTPAASNETPSATYAVTQNRQVIIGFVVNAAPLTGYQDCAQVQAGGLRLLSDLDGDCYIDYLDLDILAENWLNTDCVEPGNCQNADFTPVDGAVDFLDFSDFASQWLGCNDPENPDCTPNW